MVIDGSFLKKHLVNLVHSGVSLEGALATRSQIADLLNGKSLNLDSKTTKIIQNISLAFGVSLLTRLVVIIRLTLFRVYILYSPIR